MGQNNMKIYEEATDLARRFDCKFYEVSAYLGTNVDVIFNDLAKEIYQQKKKEKHGKRELKIEQKLD